MTTNERARLADRLGQTVHVSPLRFKLERLRCAYPSDGAKELEDWLVDVANARGARIVERNPPVSPGFTPPGTETLSHEELVAAICQTQCLDRPQMLRLAAQLISRGAADVSALRLVAERERVGRILGELARQALKVDREHGAWRAVLEAFGSEPPLREPILHWTRLAEPVMKDGRCNAAAWRLVA